MCKGAKGKLKVINANTMQGAGAFGDQAELFPGSMQRCARLLLQGMSSEGEQWERSVPKASPKGANEVVRTSARTR